jgi:putative tryptophan/tyrosine transport system substrate-binding protein
MLPIRRCCMCSADPQCRGDRNRVGGPCARAWGGVVIIADSTPTLHRAQIITLARAYRLPAIYPYAFFAKDGGLMSYGTDQIDIWRQAAGYINAILRGARPADLPVQAATKYQLVINLKTAKTLGLTVPPILLARADEVIE